MIDYHQRIIYITNREIAELEYFIIESEEDLIAGFNTSNKIGKVCSGYKTKIFRPPTILIDNEKERFN